MTPCPRVPYGPCLPQGLLALHSFQLGLLALACTIISAHTAHTVDARRINTKHAHAEHAAQCRCRRSSCKRLGLLVLGWACTQCLPSTPLIAPNKAFGWTVELWRKKGIYPECLSAKISSTLWASLGGLFKISVIRVRESKASATKRQFPHRIIIGRPGLAPRGVLKRNYHSEIMKNYHPEIMRSLLMWIPFHLVLWALMTSKRHQEIEIWEDSKTAQWCTRADKCCCQRSFTELKNWTDALSRFTWEGALMEVTIPLSPKLRVPHFNTHNYRSTTCA